MGLPIIGDIINAVKDLAGEVIVDKDKRDQILLEIKKIEDNADARLHEELLAQAEINKVEAASPSLFVAGWRPFLGWICGAGIGWTFVASPLVEWFSRLCGWTGVMPQLETGELMTLVTAMLGVAGYRTYEKTKGVHRDTMKK